MIALSRDLLDVLFATLWQGAILALAIAVVLRLAGTRINAATRAVLLQTVLVAIPAIALATTVVAAHGQRARVGGYAAGVDASPTARSASANRDRGRRIDVALDDPTVIAVTLLWAVGALAFGMRIVGGQLQVGRLIRTSTHVADRNGARVYESSDVATPFAAGFFTPAIVIPRSLAADTRTPLDAIVLHEFAHVQRRDVWINAGERALQGLLFFNPAIHAVARAIAFEREAACDDWAVERCDDLDAYVRALATFALGRAGRPDAYGTALSFGRATISRLRRLEDIRRNGATTLSPPVLRGTMLSLVSIAAAFAAFAPAIAFSPDSTAPVIAVVSNACNRNAEYIGGPFPAGLPNGNYEAQILVHLTASGTIAGTSLKKSSGNATFDSDVEKLAAKSRFASPRRGCGAVAGMYVFDIKKTKD